MASDYHISKATKFWKETGVGTNAGVTVTHTGVTGRVSVCQKIDLSGDLAALVTVESPAATILWRKRYTAAYQDSVSFPNGCYIGTSGGDLLVKISASTLNCEANIAGYEIVG